MTAKIYPMHYFEENMAADLTVDNLCAALRFFFAQIIEHPDAPVDKERGLVLHGTPGNDDMRALMEAFGGTIKITIREMPVAMQEVFLHDIAEGQEAAGVIWEPSKEPEYSKAPKYDDRNEEIWE